jgi:Delta7-sterol 5-desaturase
MLSTLTGPLADIFSSLGEQPALWLQVFTLDTLRYLVGAGLVSSMLGLFGSWSENRRIQWRRASAADVRRELTYSLLTTAVYATVALFTIHGLDVGWLRQYQSVADHGWWYTLLSLPLVLVLHDAWFYWVHRALHHPRVFRWAHAVHHKSRTPTPWAAYSFAPAEAIMMALFMPLLLAVMPLHPVVLFLFLAFMILRNAMGHSGIEIHPRCWVDTPLDLLTSTTHHDMHHQKFTGNYSLYFTWWDRWMGTELPGYKAAFRRAAIGRDAQRATLPAALEV